jgi:hypothetical protein
MGNLCTTVKAFLFVALISIVSSFVFDDEGRIHKSVDVLEKTDELEQNNKKKT